MRAFSWKTCWWPGVAALWARGRWEGLATAIAFGLALQFALLRTFAPAEMPVLLVLSASPMVAWSCVVGLWIAGVWLNLRDTNPTAVRQDPQIDQWLCEAQTEYLKGHWIEAEEVLARLLKRRPDDIEARLLLASIRRRTRRLDAARRTMEELKNYESAARWAWEIQAELKTIAQNQSHGSVNDGIGEGSVSKAA